MGLPQQSSVCTLMVHVSDVNDLAPEFVMLPEGVTVREDAAPGRVVLQLKARDGDGSYPNNKVYYR